MNPVGGKTAVCGLIGNPVEHTMSPVIHNYLAEKTGTDLVYVPFHVETGRLADAVKGAYGLNLLGLNATVPYKTDVMECVSSIDPSAEAIGAVNTLVRTDDGYRGYNTDMPGLYRAMRFDGVEVAGEQVLILGAGGVARAVALMLLEKGAEQVILLNRSREKAQELAERINEKAGRAFARALGLTEYGEIDASRKYLCIQATSVGMYPRVEEAPIEDLSFYRLVHTGYDLIFNPMETRFMKLCAEAGARVFNGYRMLLYQGVLAFTLWTGVEISEELAAETYEQMLMAMEKHG
jgi:shikimate dehydrogenase